MGSLFSQPKVDKPVSVDPADADNRRAAGKIRRLAGVGSNSTIMGQGMAGISGAPRATLTGMG